MMGTKPKPQAEPGDQESEVLATRWACECSMSAPRAARPASPALDAGWVLAPVAEPARQAARASSASRPPARRTCSAAGRSDRWLRSALARRARGHGRGSPSRCVSVCARACLYACV